MFRANFAHLQERKNEIFFTAFGLVSCCCDRQGFRSVATWQYVYGMKEAAWLSQHAVPCCRAPNPCLPQQQDTIPYVVKKPQSCAPEDGQNLPETCWADLGDQWNCYCCISLVSILPYLLVQFLLNVSNFTSHHAFKTQNIINFLASEGALIFYLSPLK